MKSISYARSFEDAILWRALGHIRFGRYVCVSARQDFGGSVSKAFYERGWRGHHFETAPMRAEIILGNQPEDFVSLVAAPVHSNVIGHHVHGEQDAPTRTISSALSLLAGQDVHWLRIDAQGLAQHVLRAWDSKVLRPWLIVIDSSDAVSSDQVVGEVDRWLLEARYRPVDVGGTHRFYVAREHADLTRALGAPAEAEAGVPKISTPLLQSRLGHALKNTTLDVSEIAADERGMLRQASPVAELSAGVDDMERRWRDAEARARDANAQVEMLANAAEQAAASVLEAEARAALAEQRAAHSSSLAARLEMDEAKAKAEVLSLASRLEVVDRSLSWRLTSPLRAVRPGLRTFESALRKTPLVSHLKRTLKKPRADERGAKPPAPKRLYQQFKAAIGARDGSMRCGSDGDYLRWIREEESWSAPVESPPASSPLVSFLLSHSGTQAELSKSLDSIRNQTQGQWEVVVFGCPGEPGDVVPNTSAELNPDSRIRFQAEPSCTRQEGLRMALERSQGQFVAFLESGDLLAPKAMNEILATLALAPHADIVYSDEDQRSEEDSRHLPYFKPIWSPELLGTFNYFGRLTLLRRSLVHEAGGIDPSTGSAVEWDINLRVSDAAGHIERIAKVLCHRAPASDRERSASVTNAAADRRAVIEAYWARKGFQATAHTRSEGTQRVTWPIEKPPSVSIIIPVRDRAGLLRQCVDGLLSATDGARNEIILVDTGSKESATWACYDELRRANPEIRILRFDRPLNPFAARNAGAANARGDILLFLSAGVEVISSGWMQEMLRYVERPDVGVVGAKVLDASGELRHIGVGVGHRHCGEMYAGPAEQGWGICGSPNHPRNWMAIAGACQMVRREVFESIGGFDESYRFAMGDIALCLRAWRAGYRMVYAADSRLVEHEGASVDDQQSAADLQRVVDDLQSLGIDTDPYLHPALNTSLAVPLLRFGSASSARQETRLRADFGGSSVASSLTLDFADDGRCLTMTGLARSEALWLPQAAHKVNDIWSAARWCLDLLRCRPDLHRRFPRALSSGADGDFARWLKNEGAVQRRLPPSLITAIDQLLATDISANARRAFFFDTAYRQAMPQGLTPAGLRESFRWFMQNRARLELRLEEVWWLIWTAQENPELELVRAYLFTPQWQRLYPDGVTIFGRRAFAHWFAAHYRVSAEWVDAVNWPLETSASRQLRRAYGARPDWRERHPRALDNAESARGLLAWLRSGEAMLSEEARAWCLQLDGDTVVSELVSPGVNVMGHFCYPSGLRVSVEALVGGLKLAGVQTALRDVRTDKKDDPHHLLFDSQEDFDITVIHTQPEPFFDEVYERCDLAERGPRTYRIAYWYWEFDAVPPSWAKQAAQVDEVWAATEFVAKGLRSLLTIPVKTVFPGVKLAAYERRSLAHFGLEEGPFTFLFTFHMMSIMERKNPLGLIRAFQLAFKPTDNVRLVLKTSFGDRHPAQMRELREAAAGSNITIIDQLFSPDEVLSLMDACDAYVSLHRSEGLGLTMAEAMLMGKPVIATNYSGNVAFMDESNSLPVDYTLVKVGRPIPPYDAESEWAEPSTEHAAQLMKRVVADPAWARELGARAKASADLRLSLTTSGRVASIRLTEIAAERRRSR